MLFVIDSRTRYGLGLSLLLFCLAAWAIVGVPELSRRVTDLTATLSTEQVAALENKLAAFETQKGSQIAVLIVPTTGAKDIAEFGIEVADLWQVGRKGVDDGVILIVAKDDRKLRLEVGYGLEGVIPDAVAKQVISETITPYFKNGDYAGGSDGGGSRFSGLFGGEALRAPLESSAEGQGDEAFVFVLFGGLVVGLMLSAMMGHVMGGMLAGLGSGLVATLVFGITFMPAVFIGLMIFFIVGVRSSGGHGWSSGGFGGSSGGGSSWSGGGFGGGGASGSW
jgi:uncharacterized protein